MSAVTVVAGVYAACGILGMTLLGFRVSLHVSGKAPITAHTVGAILGLGFAGVFASIGLAQDPSILTMDKLAFVWHPMCMAAATTSLIPPAFDLVAIRHQPKARKIGEVLVMAHAALQWFSVFASAAGFVTIYSLKPEGKHFLSLHSWVGALALGLMLLNTLGGAAKSAMIGGLRWRDAIHRAAGSLAFSVMCGATATGMYNKVLVLPDGWGGALAQPNATWLEPGKTWLFTQLEPRMVYALLGLLALIKLLVLYPRPSPGISTSHAKGE
eukprot:CAMPEP_0118963726 /NCGR_PEP_ID=MMETSP1173-20130426/1536_1 /TAXON_ID=1034831 /ORGANISM="Rhizochromulina marina cf, Strain CCMP1243" /LENGTH=269 /DNA_ID=CAMNT_0006912085 /DNA_START=38 /DNA_END=847 /DNA_ORIENTATION=-